MNHESITKLLLSENNNMTSIDDLEVKNTIEIE